ncbi:HPr family phosphocarrier protein [Aquibacillus salsiterrae]|uniref:HPr family phosphocarrier protein n=1 Tax=Aquibacillus salsiterrae TaxID=2950439 RepID=A0A9X4ADZ7_9BACI|nr:HPr family phosphocarrier protein [Aquibacillus salsiterrae]MDC3416167.1 HPr family phosphocarrier protein [Aquibacillus salsiterrae]
MIEKSVVVELESGLQARLAAEFVQKANGYVSEVFLEKDGRRVNAKSIMGLMSLAITSGEPITIIANGKDDETAVNELTNFVKN